MCRITNRDWQIDCTVMTGSKTRDLAWANRRRIWRQRRQAVRNWLRGIR